MSFDFSSGLDICLVIHAFASRITKGMAKRRKPCHGLEREKKRNTSRRLTSEGEICSVKNESIKRTSYLKTGRNRGIFSSNHL